MIKLPKLAIVISMLLCTFNTRADEISDQGYLEESRKTAQEFVQKLGGILKAQLETVGTEQAILVCKQIAPALAKEYSNSMKIVNRVSLKNRNPSIGIPDTWETSVLKEFEEKNKDGNNPVLEKYETIQSADRKLFRYMRAIPTQAVCLQCHGKPEDIKPNVYARLLKEYPDDKAIGYSLGEIRGAITIKIYSE